MPSLHRSCTVTRTDEQPEPLPTTCRSHAKTRLCEHTVSHPPCTAAALQQSHETALSPTHPKAAAVPQPSQAIVQCPDSPQNSHAATRLGNILIPIYPMLHQLCHNRVEHVYHTLTSLCNIHSLTTASGCMQPKQGTPLECLCLVAKEGYASRPHKSSPTQEHSLKPKRDRCLTKYT